MFIIFLNVMRYFLQDTRIQKFQTCKKPIFNNKQFPCSDGYPFTLLTLQKKLNHMCVVFLDHLNYIMSIHRIVQNFKQK